MPHSVPASGPSVSRNDAVHALVSSTTSIGCFDCAKGFDIEPISPPHVSTSDSSRR